MGLILKFAIVLLVAAMVYSWFRRAHPDVSAYAATPNVAHQRASATDIHHRRGIDRLPVLRSVLVPARYLKNLLRARK